MSKTPKMLSMGNGSYSQEQMEHHIQEVRDCFVDLSGVQQGAMSCCNLTKEEAQKEWSEYLKKAKKVVEDLAESLLGMGVDFRDYNAEIPDEIRTVGELRKAMVCCENEEPLYFVKKGMFTSRELRCIGVGSGAGGRVSTVILE